MLDIRETAQKGVLIAAHRGCACANIPCNSMAAFKTALNHGAQIIELDVARSHDGVLYVFHPGTEPVFLQTQTPINQMNSHQIEALHLVNQDNTATNYCVPRLDETLSFLKGKCYINLDKFWTYPEEIAALVRRMNMQDQVLIKTTDTRENFSRVEQCAWDIPYMVITRGHDWFTDELMNRNMRYVGLEALFETEDSPLAQQDYLQTMRKQHLITWVNSIVYDEQVVLSAHHTDDISVSESPNLGWGWLIDRGFSIIQTDWTLALNCYLKERYLNP